MYYSRTFCKMYDTWRGLFTHPGDPSAPPWDIISGPSYSHKKAIISQYLSDQRGTHVSQFFLAMGRICRQFSSVSLCAPLTKIHQKTNSWPSRSDLSDLSGQTWQDSKSFHVKKVFKRESTERFCEGAMNSIYSPPVVDLRGKRKRVSFWNISVCHPLSKFYVLSHLI